MSPGLGRRRRVRPVLQRVPTTDGVSLAVDLYPCAKPRAAVLLLHGGGQSRHAWDATAQRLHARGYLAAAYDARGHGIVTGTRMAAMTLIDSAATCSRCVRTRQVGTLLWPLELPSAV